MNTSKKLVTYDQLIYMYLYIYVQSKYFRNSYCYDELEKICDFKDWFSCGAFTLVWTVDRQKGDQWSVLSSAGFVMLIPQCYAQCTLLNAQCS